MTDTESHANASFPYRSSRAWRRLARIITFGTVGEVPTAEQGDQRSDNARTQPPRVHRKVSRSAGVRYRWILWAALALTFFVLGFWGLDQYYQSKSKTFWDVLYYDFKLLTFGGAPHERPDYPWQLQIARFALPLVVLSGAFAGVLALFRERYEQARLPFVRGHVLIAGLGDKGLSFVQAMRAQGAKVVAIESDASNPNIAAARDVGATVVLGDSTDEGVLAAAGVRRARSLLATADDATNAEVALQAERLTRVRRRGPLLECLAHVVDPDLCLLLKVQALATAHGGGFRVDFFNFYEQAARIACDRTLTDERRVVLVGDSPLVDQIALRIATMWSLDATPDQREMTVVHPDAERHVDAILARHPTVAAACTVRALTAELDAPLMHGLQVLASDKGPAIVYICATNDAVGVEIALALKARVRQSNSRIVVCTGSSAGLASVLTGGIGESPLDSITVLALARETCTSDLVSQGIYEILGRAVHDDYVRARQSEGTFASDDPALKPWDELLPIFKDSDRAQAEHIGVKLRAIGCDLVPLGATEDDDVVFTSAEVELLAKMEHDRWMDERRKAGWRFGKTRDPEARTNPYLVGWDELEEEIRDRDRETVHRIPMLVALAGFRVQRLRRADDPDADGVDG